MPRGILSATKDHLLQVHWSCEFLQEDGNPDKVQNLDKLDVETLGSRDQIMIHHHCVLIRASEWCHGIKFDIKLPPQVKCVIVKKFGNSNAYCYFTQRGDKTRKGKKLRWDPFKSG